MAEDQLNPDGVFDVLAVVRRLARGGRAPGRAEIHALSYLACLLGLFRGLSVSRWGYAFVSTDVSVPYARDLEEAIDVCVASRLLVEQEEAFRLTELGTNAVSTLASLVIHEWRVEFLEAACDATMVVPGHLARQALAQEPGLRSARVHREPSALLTEQAIAGVHDEFATLRDVTKDAGESLFVPSSLWLASLADRWLSMTSDMGAEVEE